METVSAVIFVIVIITFVITFMRGIYNCIPDTMSLRYVLLQLLCVYNLCPLFCYFAC